MMSICASRRLIYRLPKTSVDAAHFPRAHCGCSSSSCAHTYTSARNCSNSHSELCEAPHTALRLLRIPLFVRLRSYENAIIPRYQNPTFSLLVRFKPVNSLRRCAMWSLVVILLALYAKTESFFGGVVQKRPQIIKLNQQHTFEGTSPRLVHFARDIPPSRAH